MKIPTVGSKFIRTNLGGRVETEKLYLGQKVIVFGISSDTIYFKRLHKDGSYNDKCNLQISLFCQRFKPCPVALENK